MFYNLKTTVPESVHENSTVPNNLMDSRIELRESVLLKAMDKVMGKRNPDDLSKFKDHVEKFITTNHDFIKKELDGIDLAGLVKDDKKYRTYKYFENGVETLGKVEQGFKNLIKVVSNSSAMGIPKNGYMAPFGEYKSMSKLRKGELGPIITNDGVIPETLEAIYKKAVKILSLYNSLTDALIKEITRLEKSTVNDAHHQADVISSHSISHVIAFTNIIHSLIANIKSIAGKYKGGK